MRQYDIKCPVCGAMNRGLYLEETQGWMECDCCHSVMETIAFGFGSVVPIMTNELLAAMLKQEGYAKASPLST